MCLVSLAAVLVLVGAIAAGAMDRFGLEETARRSAIGALLAYWFVLFAVVWLIPFGFRHRKQAALCVVATAATLGLVEIGARGLVPGADVVSIEVGGFRSRQFHHLYPPHTRRFMGRFDGEPVFLETNEDGLRTEYSKEEFKKHDQRVIFLGDSFTFGLGVASQATFPSVVEARLRQAADRGSIAVLNAAIVSYSPFLESLLLEKKLADYSPTLIVLVLDATDIGDDYAYMKSARRSDGAWVFPFDDAAPVEYRGALVELTRPYRRRLLSALTYPLLLAGYQPRRNAVDYDYYDFEIAVGKVVEHNRYFIYRHPLDDTRDFFDGTMKNIDQIAARAAGLGAAFALVITPRYHHWNPGECPDNWEKTEYALAEPYQFEYFRYFDEARREYPILNLLPDFQAADKYPLVFREDPHWNTAGHAFVAETVARHLLNRGLIRP